DLGECRHRQLAVRDKSREEDGHHEQRGGDRPKNEEARRTHRPLPPDAGAGRPPDSETLLPSCNLSTPSVTTVSPGVSPETISVRSPSAVPSVTVRTVTVRSGWMRYT